VTTHAAPMSNVTYTLMTSAKHMLRNAYTYIDDKHVTHDATSLSYYTGNRTPLNQADYLPTGVA